MTDLGGFGAQVRSQLGGLSKHVVKKIIRSPYEILSDSVNDGDGKVENITMKDVEQGAQVQQTQHRNANNFGGFATKQDFERYEELAERRDEIELRQIRRLLHGQYGLPTNLEQGMERARTERIQKREQEEQVKEKEKEKKKILKDDKEKEESMQVRIAKAQSGAETRVGKKIAG